MMRTPKDVCDRLREEFPELAGTGKFPRARAKELLCGKPLIVIRDWPTLDMREVICPGCLELFTLDRVSEFAGERVRSTCCGLFVIY